MLFIALVAFGFSVNAQKGTLKAEVILGYAVGDASGEHSFVLTAGANYLFDVFEGVKVGPSASIVNFFAKSGGGTNIDNVAYLPLAFATRFEIFDEFYVGGDGGYAFGISPDVNKGGVYYKIMAGYNINKKLQITSSISAINARGSGFTTFGVGLLFGL